MAGKKILIVDDSTINTTQTRSLLSRTNCSVITASDGKKALEKIRDERPDLVLMDLYMPELNGDDCCRIVKADQSLRDIPIIIHTASKGEEERKRCTQAGCDDYLTRPITDTDAFLKSIKRFVDIPLRNFVRVSIDTEISYTHNGATYLGKLQNVSKSGGFIGSATPLPAGSIIILFFTIPNSSNRVEASAEIIRIVVKTIPSTRIVSGMGINFLGMSWAGKNAIEDYVRAKERKLLTVA